MVNDWIMEYVYWTYLSYCIVIKFTILCSAKDIQELAVIAGEDTTLPCTVTSDYPSWTGPEIYNNYTQIYNNHGQSSFPNPNVPEQKRARLKWGSDKSSLIIRDVILSDKGLYQCSSVAKINLTVRVPPSSPVISNTESVNGTLIIRKSQLQETTLVCTSSGGYPQPQVKWYRGNIGTQPLISTSSVNSGNNSYTVTQTYRFTPQRQDDGVKFICQSSFKTSPRHIATASAELSLNLMPDPPTVKQTPVVSAGNQTVIMCTTTGSRPAANITWSYRNTNPRGEERTTLNDVTKTYKVVSLLKMQVTAEDNGRTVQCKVTHFLLVNSAQLTAEVNLDVRFSVQASSTKLTGNKEIEATGSTQLILKCTTGSSNPASSIKWLNGSTEITNTRSYTTWTGTNNGKIRSQQLVLYPTRYMDGDVIKCEVSNVLNSQSPVLDTTTLNFIYKPIVTIEGQQQQYIFTEGDSNLLLTCKVESKPTARITWYHFNVQISQDTPTNNSLTCSLSSVNRSHYGNYTCRANNGIGTGDEKTVTVKVKFKPLSTTITGDTNIIANERNTVQLTCTSGSSYPVSDITWRNSSVIIPATGIPTDIDGDYGGKKRLVALTFTPTRYNDGDIISCEANNTIGTSEKSTKALDLRYRPMIYPIPDKTVVEGNDTILTCKASSKPVSTLKWYREGEVIALKEGIEAIGNNRLLFTKENIRRTDAATYICNANNGVETPDNRNVTLTVHYPPDVKAIGINTTINASRLAITCNATGVPNTGYKYGKWVQRWPGYNSSLKVYPNGKILELENLTYEHSGVYFCSASNGIKVFGTNTEFIDGSVRLVVESFPLITNYSEKISAKLMRNATFDFDFYSNVDESDIKLYQNVNGSKEEKSLHLVSQTDALVDLRVFTRTLKTNGTKAQIVIPIKSKEDLGVYDVVVSNRIGQVTRSFEIVPKGPPSVPMNMTVDEIQYNHVRISWMAGYHGGAPQTFVIQMSSDLVIWKNESIEGGLTESTDPMYYVLSHLSASTTYYVKMLAYNKEGSSQFTDILNYTTSAKIDGNGGSGSSALIGGAAGGGVAVVVIVVVLLSIFLKRRGTFTKGKDKSYHGHSDRKPVNEDEDDYGMQDNPMYVSAGPREQPVGESGSSDASAVYSKVDQHNHIPDSHKNDVYTEVDKSRKTKETVPDNVYSMPVKQKGKKEKEKKGKNKHGNMKDKKGMKVINEGDIYENTSPTELKKQMKSDEIIYENPEPKKNVNKDGLIYADLTFNDQPKGQKKLVIHGLDSMTEYVEVDFTKKADPLPDSDDENVPPK